MKIAFIPTRNHFLHGDNTIETSRRYANNRLSSPRIRTREVNDRYVLLRGHCISNVDEILWNWSRVRSVVSPSTRFPLPPFSLWIIRRTPTRRKFKDSIVATGGARSAPIQNVHVVEPEWSFARKRSPRWQHGAASRRAATTGEQMLGSLFARWPPLPRDLMPPPTLRRAARRTTSTTQTAGTSMSGSERVGRG